jgi:hypothetical protein
MKTSKVLLGGLTGTVAYFLLGWLIYGLLLMDYTLANQNQCASRSMEDMAWWAMILSNLAGGFLLSITMGWSNNKGLLSGAKVGAVIGLLYAASVDLGMYAMTSLFLNFKAVVVDVAVYTFMSAIAGALIGLIMGLGKKAEN